MFQIDLNCDLGESYGAYKMGNDTEILNYITSANVACGFHAGDPRTMRETVKLCLQHGVAIGAHPGLADLAGFGRRPMEITPEEAYEMTVYQIGALYGFVKAEGALLRHVKPHGALYNMAAVSRELSEAIAKAVYRIDPELILFGLAGSELVKAGERMGLNAAHEVFADRTYQRNGTLTPRNRADALVTEPNLAVDQVIQMVKKGEIRSIDGDTLSIRADTVCIHGDGPHALEFACTIKERLELSGIQVLPV